MIVRIPTPLYHNWQSEVELLIQSMPHAEVQKIVYTYLRNWILSNYPLHKLCAFEEIDTQTAEKIGKEQGMYIRLREMTKEEYILAQQMNKEGKLGLDGNPQWMLETSQVFDEQTLISNSQDTPA